MHSLTRAGVKQEWKQHKNKAVINLEKNAMENKGWRPTFTKKVFIEKVHTVEISSVNGLIEWSAIIFWSFGPYFVFFIFCLFVG